MRCRPNEVGWYVVAAIALAAIAGLIVVRGIS